MAGKRLIGYVGVFVALTGASAPEARRAPSVPGIDAPELARMGTLPVGTMDETFVQTGQVDPLSTAEKPAVVDRRLVAKVWYPAAARGRAVTYHAAMSGEDARDVKFTVPGVATQNARPASGSFPLVILAHGYGNAPEALSWLGENLASKGYVVVAPAFRDPPIAIRTATAAAGPLSRRPLDVAYIASQAQARARQHRGPFAAADPSRTALIGYSMGGYGVLTAAGAPLSPTLGGATRGVLTPFAAGGPLASTLRVADVKAVVAIAPANGARGNALWAEPGVDAIRVPTFYIVGSQDRAVGYDPGVRTLFQQQAHAPRYLLTFREAGHSIALTPTPPEMRGSFWNEDWFEDSVWRKDRLLAVQTHFVTAFLDRYVKGLTEQGRFLDGLVEQSDDGKWAGLPPGRHARYSPGMPVTTVWTGFQPGRAIGMSLEYRAAQK